MSTFERTYDIPLRQSTLRAPRRRRAKKAVTAVREFAQKHGKSADVVIGEQLNEHLWEQGITNPPAKVKVTMLKEKNGRIYVNLVGSPVKPKLTEEKTA